MTGSTSSHSVSSAAPAGRAELRMAIARASEIARDLRRLGEGDDDAEFAKGVTAQLDSEAILTVLAAVAKLPPLSLSAKQLAGSVICAHGFIYSGRQSDDERHDMADLLLREARDLTLAAKLAEPAARSDSEDTQHIADVPPQQEQSND